jgi:hypothetical protein
MTVEAKRIPPIHQRKFEIGREKGESLFLGVVIFGSLISASRLASHRAIQAEIDLRVRLSVETLRHSSSHEPQRTEDSRAPQTKMIH